MASYLDVHRAWRNEGTPTDHAGAEEWSIAGENKDQLVLSIRVKVPRGEDILVGDGQGLDVEIEPQRVFCADGTERWKIPGSSLRGIIRSWMTRLAARDPAYRNQVNDSWQNWSQNGEEVKGDDLLWGYGTAHEEQRERTQRLHDERNSADMEEIVACPIMRLFGSGYSKGRIHISDALSNNPLQSTDQHLRAHVAVDRITGGANDGFFFQNNVLTGKPEFPFTITIQHPEEHEVIWLLSALRAIDVGVIRIGSSKAGGRLALAANPIARGEYSDRFDHVHTRED
jgi:CRISPR/Cas system CSM-associated protein Csm3 (group 7 of RAMP superfamily)